MLNWIADWTGSRAMPAESSGAEEYGASEGAEAKPAPGIIAGTEIATPDGWVAVERLCVGQQVITFDHGPQPLRAVTRRLHPGPNSSASGALVHIAPGILGNRAALSLAPEQGVILESDLAEAAWGDPFAMVAARDLMSLPGVQTILPDAALVAVTLACESDEILFANGQALIHCPTRATLEPKTIEEALWGSGESQYRLLDASEARLLTAEILKDVRQAPVALA